MLGDLLSLVESLSASPWFPLVIFVVAAVDAVFPVVPSETAVILGGSAAAFGEHPFLLVVACGAVGAFLGDAASYAVGRTAGPRLWRRAGDGSRRRLLWAQEQLRIRGSMFIVTARFVPGGRTAVTLASGLTSQPRRRFLATVAVAVLLWATYAAGIGFVFGSAFADDHLVALLVALGVAGALAMAFEVVRRVRERPTPG